MKNQLRIDSDNLFVSQRLKEIDKSYFVVFNILSGKYEVHSSDQKGGTYCFTLPYEILDDRAITYARKTRVDRMDEIIKEIDKQNEKVEKRAYKDAVDRIKEVIEWN